MRLFPFVYIFVYTLMHLYVVLKMKTTFKIKSKSVAFLMFFSITMVMLPVIMRLAELPDTSFLRNEILFWGFLWMGFMALFCIGLLICDVYNLLAKVCSRLFANNSTRLSLSAKYCFLIPFFIALMLVAYGHYEAQNIVIERITLYTNKFPASVNKLKIVHISDVHIGPIVREKKLKRIVQKVREAEPDILVATGDIVDGQINHNHNLIMPFNNINPRYGKYAVMGNHEFYVGIDQAVDFMQKAGFRVLRGDWVNVEGFLNIAGVDDPVAKNFTKEKTTSEKQLLSSLPRDNYTIFLKHRPDVKPDYLGLFDIQLSGHTHKGQFIPFNIVTNLIYEVHTGLERVSEDSYLYVNRGLGTAAPPIRILSPPEVAVIEILRTP